MRSHWHQGEDKGRKKRSWGNNISFTARSKGSPLCLWGRGHISAFWVVCTLLDEIQWTGPPPRFWGFKILCGSVLCSSFISNLSVFLVFSVTYKTAKVIFGWGPFDFFVHGGVSLDTGGFLRCASAFFFVRIACKTFKTFLCNFCIGL